MAIKVSGTEVISDDKRILNNEDLPDIRPSLLLDFANSKTLDPRITFTRGSTATYWDGKTTTKAEENILLKSQDFSDSYWTKSNGYISSSTETAPDGSSTAVAWDDDVLTDSNYRIYKILSNVSTTQNITFSVYAKANGRTQLFLRTGSGNSDAYGIIFDLSDQTTVDAGDYTQAGYITSVGNGWYRCEAVFIPQSSNYIPYMGLAEGDNPTYTATGGDGLLLWGAQVEYRDRATAYTATTSSPIVKYQPTLQTAASGEARFDHDPVTGESKGLLIEEARTNIQRHSETFGTTWITTGCSVSGPSAIAPDGTNAAVTIIDDTTTARHGPFDQSNTIASGSNYTLSCYLKKNYGTDYAQIHFNSGSLGNAWVAVLVNLADGTVEDAAAGSSANLVGSGIEDVGNGWYRAYVTGNYASTEGHVKVLISNTASPSRDGFGNINYTGAYTRSILAWGAQFEAGAFPTSYIPTSGSTVTRSEDGPHLNNSTLSGWYNTNEGTVLAKFRLGFNSDADQRYIVSGGSGYARWAYTNSSDNNSVVNYDGTSNTVTNVTADNVTSTVASASSLITLKKNLSVDGRLATELAASGYMNTLTTEFRLGYFGSGTQLNGWLAKFAYYPIAFDRTTLAAMTEE